MAKFQKLDNAIAANNQKTIEIKNSFPHIWGIPRVITRKPQETPDSIARDSRMGAGASPCEKGSKTRGLDAGRNRGQAMAKIATPNKSPRVRIILGAMNKISRNIQTDTGK